ncbi:putative peptidase [uncultured phage cr125_1]|uniref:Peptidase n=1 Tax=uncultured phage cr125_1 TaxID=2772091 RepID=A0A7M1RX26_9CAUD|nr:endolysin [uncultured phage cr125_1]QOR57550.1 putative peptidase [uncultured phage cr125_1]
MKHFTIEEMTESSTAKAKDIDNTPSLEILAKLLKLIEAILDPLREWYGKPIRVNSGYRCEALNKVVGSKANNSLHLYGEAADITAGSKEENKKLFEYIKDNLPFDQLINESDFSWIHVSYREGRLRKQVLAL